MSENQITKTSFNTNGMLTEISIINIVILIKNKALINRNIYVMGARVIYICHEQL